MFAEHVEEALAICMVIVLWIFQIELSGGNWVDVVVDPDHILVNCGLVMQRWTADLIKAVVSINIHANGSHLDPGPNCTTVGFKVTSTLRLSLLPPFSDFIRYYCHCI